MIQCIYLKPRSAFPYPLHSDTIFGALCVGIQELYGNDKLENLLSSFNTKLPFLVSSAFPFIEANNKRVHFFPNPIIKPQKIENLDVKKLKKAKAYKKTKYVSEWIFNQIISEKLNAMDLIEGIENIYKVKSGLLFDSNQKLVFKIATIDTPRNAINRINGSTDIFYSSGTYFEHSGLFFMVKYKNQSCKKLVKPVWRFLQDRGIGGDISSGKGEFKVEFGKSNNNPIEEPEDTNAILTLSLYHPSKDEIKEFANRKEGIWYNLITRKGKSKGRKAIGSWRKSIRCFGEGSTFPDIRLDKYGKIETILEKDKSKLNHDIIQYGIAYPVKIKR